MRRFFMLLATVSCILLFSSIAWANEPATPELTFQQAVDRAKVNSRALQTANLDIDRGKEVRDQAADNVKFTPNGPSTPAADKAFTGLVQADLNWQMSKRTLLSQEDYVIMQAYQLYDGLLQAQEKVKLAEVQLKNAERQRNVADASVRVGILSKMGLIQAQAAVEAANSTLDGAKKSLDDTYQKFNQLVGLEPADRPVLTSTPEYSELKVDDLDAAVSRALDTSPTIWLKGKQIELARLTLNLYDWSNASQSDSYDAKKIDVGKAEVSAGDAKDQLDKQVRSIYYSARKLEAQYDSAKESVSVAEEALRVARVKYEVGMAVETDVLTAEVSLAQAKQTLVDLTSQHDILVYAFSKPWTYSSS